MSTVQGMCAPRAAASPEAPPQGGPGGPSQNQHTFPTPCFPPPQKMQEARYILEVYFEFKNVC